MTNGGEPESAGYADDDVPVQVIRETLLSRSPAASSRAVAAAGVAVLLLVSGVYWTDAAGLAEALPASREAVLQRGEYWRLLTSLGAHADARHLLANSALFGVLAYLLHGYFGSAVFPGLATALGVLTTALTVSGYPAQVRLVGASGMVYAMAAFWLTLYMLVERRLRPGRRLLRATGFGLIVLFPTAFEPQVSYRAHAIGFALGATAGAAFFAQRRSALRAAERVAWE